MNSIDITKQIEKPEVKPKRVKAVKFKVRTTEGENYYSKWHPLEQFRLKPDDTYETMLDNIDIHVKTMSKFQKDILLVDSDGWQFHFHPEKVFYFAATYQYE